MNLYFKFVLISMQGFGKGATLSQSQETESLAEFEAEPHKSFKVLHH